MDPITGLALARISIGATTMLSPRLAAKLFLLDVEGNPQLPYMARMFASREIAVGALTLASKGAARRTLAKVGAGVDACDAFASISALRSGEISKPAGVVVSAAALGAVGAAVAGLNAGD